MNKSVSEPRVLYIMRCFGIISLAVTSCGGSGNESTRKVEYAVKCDLVDNTATPSDAGDKGPAVEVPWRASVYLDASIPMAGFLPTPGNGQRSIIVDTASAIPASVTSTLASQGRKTSVRWVGVGDSLSDLGENEPKLDAGRFVGGSTDLDAALRDLRDKFESRQIDAGFLVSDLIHSTVVQGSQRTSGAAALQSLIRWLKAEAVSPEHRSAPIGAWIVALRASYSGVKVRSCDNAPKDPRLGCFFSELESRWHPLQAIIEKPMYVLVFSRSVLEGRALVRDFVRRLSELRQTEKSKAAEVFELSPGVADSARTALSMACRAFEEAAPDRVQSIVRQLPDGSLSCRKATGEVMVECAGRLPQYLATDSAFGDALTLSGVNPQTQAVELRTRGEDVLVATRVACDGKITGATLDISLARTPVVMSPARWASYSTERDFEAADHSRTLRLNDMLNPIAELMRPSALTYRCSNLVRIVK